MRGPAARGSINPRSTHLTKFSHSPIILTQPTRLFGCGALYAKEAFMNADVRLIAFYLPQFRPFVNAHPANYERWLTGVIAQTRLDTEATRRALAAPRAA